MNILIIGSGAREHAIARALKRSPQTPAIYNYGAQTNPGLQEIATALHIGPLNQLDAIIQQAKLWQIDLAIIGPENPLEQGLADLFWQQNMAAIGPKKQLAQIETSKAFTRDLFKRYNIPGSPRYQTFQSLDGVREFLQQLGEDNYVVKANGLMGGKGVKVAGDHLHSWQEAYAFCQQLQAQKMPFVIEEKLIGQEFSLLCFCDGYSLVPMPLVQDHKRAFVADQGPNTGGMGSYSDANHRLPFLTENDIQQAQHINEALLNALTAEYRERYVGILYGSFIATKNGIRLIEYNARFGDPEAMNVLAILETDFVAICTAMVTGTLTQTPISFAHLATVCKYAVPRGYPDQPLVGSLIDTTGVHYPEQLYFAAVDKRAEKLYTLSSRALAVVGIAQTLVAAERVAEDEINRIQGDLFHREDIGTGALISKRIHQMQELRQCYN